MSFSLLSQLTIASSTSKYTNCEKYNIGCNKIERNQGNQILKKERFNFILEDTKNGTLILYGGDIRWHIRLKDIWVFETNSQREKKGEGWKERTEAKYGIWLVICGLGQVTILNLYFNSLIILIWLSIFQSNWWEKKKRNYY